MTSHIKQIVGCFLAIALMTSSFGLQPAKVQAQVGPVLTADLAAIAELGYISGVKTSELTITSVLNGLVWAAAGAVVQGMTRSLVNWINSGFEGSPAFATDIENELRGWTDGIVDRFIERAFANIAREIGEAIDGIDIGGNLNLPFRISIVNDARYSYYQKTSSTYFQQRLRPTLGNCSSNPSAFLGGDFNEGGWTAWFCAIEEQNNPYGFRQLVQGQLNAEVAAGRQERETEILIGDGFLGFRRCTDGSSAGASTGGAANLSSGSKQTGPNCTIATPGSLARDAAPESMRVAFDRLNLADSINEIAGALISQIVGQMFSQAGFLGLSEPRNGGRSFLEDATDPGSQPGVNTNTNINTIPGTGGITSVGALRNDYTREETENFRDNWLKIQEAADAAYTTVTALINCYQTRSVALGILRLPQLNDQKEEIETIQEEADERLSEAATVLAALDAARATAEQASSTEATVPGINQTVVANAHIQASSNSELGNTMYRMLVNMQDESAEDLLVCQD
jgi:hypothetical protein